jgi:galactokinase
MKEKLIQLVKNKFLENFGASTLVVFSPGRINLIGEHTDYNDGYTFPAAIDKGIALAIAKTEDENSTAFAIDKDEHYTFSLDEVKRIEKGGWRNYILGVIGEIKKLGIEIGNFNLAFSGNIPGGAGMSSSAALENSVAFALNELFELNLTKKQMILVSQKAEHNYAKVNCGIMDQYASMFGEEDSALLMDCRSITSEAFKIDFKDYQLLLINTNVKHDLSESAYNDRRMVCERVSEMLKVKALRDANIQGLNRIKDQLKAEDYQKALYVIQENMRVRAFMTAIENKDLKTIGELLYQSHEGLSTQYKVSCAELDFLVDFAKNSNAVLGARMMGGGFGGCTINLVQQDQLEDFEKNVSKAFKEKFNKDCSIYEVKLDQGTHLVE